MAEYCSRADVLSRLTAYGFAYAADRDTLDGEASESEQARYVDAAIAWAGTLLDELVEPLLNAQDARGQSNAWLRDRAVELATWQAATAGGRDAPASLQLSFDLANQAMDRVRSGAKIPGLVYHRPSPNGGGQRWPRAVNVS